MRYFTFLAILAIIFASCQQENSSKEVQLKYSDETFTIVKSGKGDTPETGEVTIFSIFIKGDNDKVLLDRTKEEAWAKFKVHNDSVQLSQSSPVDEMISMLAVGDSAVLVYELDSLEKMNPAVAGMESIIYEISIKEIVDEEEIEKRNEELQKEQEVAMEESKAKESKIASSLAEILTSYKSNNLENVLSTDTGLKYYFVNEGTGAKPKQNDLVFVHYYGVLESDGTMFDNSYKRGQMFSFPIGQGRVIKGWDEALPLMPQGSEAVFFIPFEMAYGAAGRPPMIPEQSNLVFYIEYPE